ncbi:putative amidoligase enzyme [Arenicella xantha]|uniref:Putative amidoligase enzyme n=2 Tax=Arenicella xantha TaxID=644221 RepID=A0A395JIW4_9GAMM|nr:putative amidoligase enzyme [Arenicella xantha]
MGIEIEFAGLEAKQIADHMQATLGGKINWQSPFVLIVESDELGPFKLEMDSKQIKELGDRSNIQGNPTEAAPSFEKTYIETVSRLAGNLVPWEIVSPPMELSELHRLFPLVDLLRESGAKGTRAAMYYAFGVHLNPEPCELSAEHLLLHLKSFFCLYEWILIEGDVDFSRRVTPYINHFPNEYVLKILDADYHPDMDQLIDDYLEFNPTRNRSLDMLPMFAHIDEPRVKAVVDDDRVNARPTFHYRLPNCEIDDPNWNLNRSIEIWMAVEELALNEQLQTVCNEYHNKLSSVLSGLGEKWPERLKEMLPLPSSTSWQQSV